MIIPFYKYHGAGNDFIIVNGLKTKTGRLTEEIIRDLCHRRFGIGADGLMILLSHPQLDFQMQYFNSDGKESTMCGNGGRCMVSFARKLKLIKQSARFMATDGIHEAQVKDKDIISLRMQDVKNIQQGRDYFFLDTGSPHYVTFRDDIHAVNVVEEGRMIRYHKQFKPGGTNVDFVGLKGSKIMIRTYERGVEDETWACGTGTVATALSVCLKTGMRKNSCLVSNRGGDLTVRFKKTGNHHFTDIWLEGPAAFVFQGEVKI